MNRVIKFRAKTLNYDPMAMPEWAVGCYYQELHQDRMRHLITDGAHTFEVDEKTLGQFTGLRDKNGREIYEGDIVRFYNDVEDELIPAEVIYKADTCSFRLKPKDLDPVFLFAYWHYEVIGNIHDNPELMEEKR